MGILLVVLSILGVSMFPIQTEVQDGVLVVEFVDPELANEARIREIGEALKKAIAEFGEGPVLLDFNRVTFMSSSMLGQLAMLSQRGVPGKLKLCNVASEMREVLRIIRLDTLLDIRGDRQEGLASFAAAGGTDAVAESRQQDPEALQKAAEQGDAKAAYQLGQCYEKGRGVKADYAAAVACYRQAAEAGHAEAQYALAMCYAYGMSIAQDYDEATAWYRKAAEQGHAESQYAIAVNYQYGIGVEQDSAAARRWYQEAAAQNHQKAGEALQQLPSET